MVFGRTDLIFQNYFVNAQSYIQRIFLPFFGAVGLNFLLMHENAWLHTAVPVAIG